MNTLKSIMMRHHSGHFAFKWAFCLFFFSFIFTASGVYAQYKEGEYIFRNYTPGEGFNFTDGLFRFATLILGEDPDTYETIFSTDEAELLGWSDRKPSSIEIPKSAVLTSNDLQIVNNKSTKVVNKYPFQVVGIGGSAFSGDSFLESVDLGDLRFIGRNAFSGCSGLRNLAMNYVDSIGDYAFHKCRNLELDKISSRTIGKYAFGNTGLRNVSIRCSYIGSKAFQDCYNLETVHLDKSLKYLGPGAFAGCYNLKNITFDCQIDTIREGTFSDCHQLQTVEIGSSVKVIETLAFDDCYSLKSVVIPRNVELIGKSAFNGCYLQTVYIKGNVREIGEKAFCDSELTNLYVYADNPPKIYSNTFSNFYNFNNNNIQVFVPQDALEKYTSDPNWSKLILNKMVSKTVRKDIFGENTGFSKEMDGVTADGITELNIILPFSDDVDLNDVKVQVEVDGTECNDPVITGKFGTLEKVNNQWVIAYTAPQDFPSSQTGNEYSLDVSITGKSNGLETIIGKTQIRVMRPGVLLLHGLSSNANDCFGYLRSYLTYKGGYQSYQIINGDYHPSNLASFDYNTFNTKVVSMYLHRLCLQLRSEGIASSRYDIVGHSMGGILARKYAQEVDPKSVNRIITLNTPHSGSELGTTFGSMVELLDDFSTLSNLFTTDVSKIFGTLQKLFDSGHNQAVYDLSPSSNAIARLNSATALQRANRIPVHSIASYLENEKETYLLTTPHRYFAETPTEMASYCKYLLTDGVGNDVYSCQTIEEYRAMDTKVIDFLLGSRQNDGIVTVASQRGGLSGDHTTLYHSTNEGLGGLKSKYHHTEIHHQDDVCQRITDLLHALKTSNYFSQDGFHPVDLSNNVKRFAYATGHRQLPEFKAPTDGQFITLKVTPCDTAKVILLEVSQSDDVIRNILFAAPSEVQVYLDCDTLASRFVIPDTYSGPLTFFALGRTKDNALVGNSVTIQIEASAQLSYFYFEDGPVIEMNVGQQFEPNVVAQWSNGEWQYITPDYSTDNNAVISIDSSVITGAEEGKCLLIANYGGQKDTLQINVVANLANDIAEVATGHGGIYYSSGNLFFKSDRAYKGHLTLSVFDLNGNVCYHESLEVDMKPDMNITFSIAHLPKRLYIAQVKTSDTSVRKFVKR